MPAGAQLAADAFDRSQTVKIASGKLATIDNEIDPTTGTVKLRAMFDNTDGELFPSQFVNIRLLVDTLQDQTVIPVSAIQRGADGTYVFVVTPDQTVNQRTVKLGVQDGDKVAITAGLKAGDTVVVDGADRLRDGGDVEIPDAGQQRIAAPSARQPSRPRRRASGGAEGDDESLHRRYPEVLPRRCARLARGPHLPCREQRIDVQHLLRRHQRCGGAAAARRGGGGGGP